MSTLTLREDLKDSMEGVIDRGVVGDGGWVSQIPSDLISTRKQVYGERG